LATLKSLGGLVVNRSPPSSQSQIPSIASRAKQSQGERPSFDEHFKIWSNRLDLWNRDYIKITSFNNYGFFKIRI